MRNLILVLGDQLDPENPALAGIDRKRDGIVMIEAAGESTHVWSHQARIALFLSAMRHYAESLRQRDLPLQYLALEDNKESSLVALLREVIAQNRPQKLIVCEPGEYRLQQAIEQLCREAAIRLEIRDDIHFLCSHEAFAAWAKGRRELRMEFFYREMRRRHDVMLEDGQPAGGRWNFDSDNRAGFGKKGPVHCPSRRSSRPMPSPERSSHWFAAGLRNIRAASTISTGRSPAPTRCVPSKTSSSIVCRVLESIRMRCGRACPSAGTRCCQRR